MCMYFTYTKEINPFTFSQKKNLFPLFFKVGTTKKVDDENFPP